jgi:predicted small secreted protein
LRLRYSAAHRILNRRKITESPLVRKLLLICAATGLVLGAAACNTVKGLGRDIESVGEAGDRAVK